MNGLPHAEWPPARAHVGNFPALCGRSRAMQYWSGIGRRSPGLHMNRRAHLRTSGRMGRHAATDFSLRPLIRGVEAEAA